MADTAWKRMRGLLGRDGLGERQALWLAPCNSIHTFFMRFSIDAVFLDRKKCATAIYHDMKPWRHSWIHWTAAAVVELPAGRCEALGLKVGDCFALGGTDVG